MGKKVSLVLSGGGARGMAHIGVIEELEKQGFEIVSVTGTSMGALVGGVYALGKMEEYKNWLFGLDKVRVFKLVDFTLSTQGIVKGDKVLRKMKDFIPDANIEDLKIAYTAVAADIVNKKEVVFTSGSIYKAIRASISIPTVFTPVKTREGLLVDGGILNNVPVSRAPRVPGDILVVVNVNANIPVFKPIVSEKEDQEKQTVYLQKIKEFQAQLQKIIPIGHKESIGYFDLISKTIGLMMNQISELSLQQNTPDIQIDISKDSCGTYDFFKAEELVEIGRHTAVRSLEKYRESLETAKIQTI
jgi:NTE family protein